MEKLDLSDKVLAITGASSGLGAGLARVAADAGARLALCSRRAPALAEGSRVLATQLDVTDAPALERFAAAAFDRFGRVDLWINNAGLLEPIGPLRELDPAAMHRLLDVNVLGVAYGSRAYVRELHRRDASGTLINVSSGAGRKAYYGWTLYCATKAAVDRLSESLALEESPRLAVYAVAPGLVDTAMQTAIRSKTADEFAEVQRFKEAHAAHALQSPEGVGEKLLRFAFDPRAPRDKVCMDLRDYQP